MALANLVRSAKNDKFLKKLIAEAIVEVKTKRYLTPEDFVRCSSLSDICPREEVICSLKKSDRQFEITADLSLTFYHGKALHWVLQNEILPKTKTLLGQWTCTRCSKKHGGIPRRGPIEVGLVPLPDCCRRCKHTELLYTELAFTDEDVRLTGRPDGFLRIPGLPRLGILEGKSINSYDAWKVTNVPDMGHAIQAQAYMMLTGLPWAKIIYWDKGAGGMAALKEHFVERDEETIQRIRSMLLALWAGVRTGELPDRICGNKGCDRAKVCSVADPCFANEKKLAA